MSMAMGSAWEDDFYMSATQEYRHWEDYRRLKAENAKLRELVRDMLPFAEVGMDDACVMRRCCLYEQCEYVVGVKCTIEQHMLDRMRELGIEVE